MQLQLGLQQLLNTCEEGDFEELLFWGKIIGLNRDYYVAMGITYSDKYEFPEKRFYWALSTDFKFQPFPELNVQHREAYVAEKVEFENPEAYNDPNLRTEDEKLRVREEADKAALWKGVDSITSMFLGNPEQVLIHVEDPPPT